jgi:hypothetical protein
VRSRISDWALAESFQRFGSSARAFSSSSLRRAGSQSKTPPEQTDGLLDIGRHGLDIRAHDENPCSSKWKARQIGGKPT